MELYKVFCMVGIGGRSSFRRALLPVHSRRTCCVVSYGASQFLQFGGIMGFILLMWEFSLLWPVRSWKIKLWSARFILLIGSFEFGFVISLKTQRPVDPSIHLLIHSSLLLFLRICLTVSCVTSVSICSFCAPSFASLSAVSLPATSAYPGIHWSHIFFSYALYNLDMLFASFNMFSFLLFLYLLLVW